MKKLVQFFSLVGVSAFLSFGILMAVTGPTPNTTLTFADLLDPTFASRNLCGHEGAKRGLFFRPEVLHALAPQAVAEEMQEDTVPLWEGLTGHGHKISTASPEAQAYFDQGLALLFAFNHWEAIRSFKQAQKLDPMCAICYWGEAYALGPNINAPMEATAVEPAFAATSKALALVDNASAPEKALIEAMAKRYSPDESADRAPLDQAYSDAMADVYAAHPDDLDIATFYAESIMDLSPWDYWERDFTTAKPHIVKAISAVEKVLAAKENHPGAIHLYIHLTEPSRTPERAAPFADRLAAQLPAAGHLVHMPGHTYFRIGRYLDALDTNVKAVAADESYLGKVDGSDIYRYGYYPHNVHFVLVSAQMAGNQGIALEFAEKLDALIPMEMATTAPWVQPIKAAPLFAYLQYGDADKIAAIPEPPESLPYLKGMWHYVQGVSAAREGDLAAAGTHASALAAVRAHPAIAEMDEQDVPASDVLQLSNLVIQARMAQATKDNESALSLLAEAADLQNTIPYSEPPYWYYPVQQTLGAVLLESGKPESAAAAFRDSLMIHPNNAWSLYGLMKAQEGSGDPAAAITKKLYEDASALKGEVPLDRL